ncbi:MAG: hypothetical protein P4L83_21110 [Nevskia sp.]|nr:hypothetical protein [Nevskia sp.]
MSVNLDLTWLSPGPVSSRFMGSMDPLQILNGPVGSGKTTTVMMKAIRLASGQAPAKRTTLPGPDGARLPVRRFRVAVVRDTYRQLWRTTIPSWFTRVPREVGSFTGAEGAPAVHRVSFALGDGTLVDFQADFVAIGDQAAEEVLRGYEVTAFYLNELDMLSEEVWEYAKTRTGRFPPMDDGGPSWHGVLADANAPILESWLYRKVFLATEEERLAQGVALFRQPSGLSPAAENVRNLPGGADYYPRLWKITAAWLRKRMIENEPGYSRAGQVVYPEFSDAVHVAQHELEPLRGIKLGIGLDAALHPAAVLGQRVPSGQWRITDELVGEAGTGPTRFGQMLARLLAERYAGFPAEDIEGVADPSAAYGADKVAGEKTWIEIVAAQTGIRVRPAPTNAKIPRWEAVRLPLTRLIDGQPGLILSPRCKLLRAGFNAEYRFRRKHTQDEQYDEEAEKNDVSHPHDGLQYLCLWGGENIEIRRRVGEERRRAGSRPTQLSTGFAYDM